jgi:hypothetical protein
VLSGIDYVEQVRFAADVSDDGYDLEGTIANDSAGR